MTTLKRVWRGWLAGAVLASAVFVGFPAAPAHADADLGSYVGLVETAYNLFNQYVLDNKPVSDLDRITAAIAHSQTVIVAQIDAMAAADVRHCTLTAVEQFENIKTMTVDTLQSFARDSVDYVTLAGADIDAADDAGKAAIDEIGFALNVVGPIALFATADAGQRTDILKQDLILGNQHLMTRLAPTC